MTVTFADEAIKNCPHDKITRIIFKIGMMMSMTCAYCGKDMGTKSFMTQEMSQI